MNRPNLATARLDFPLNFALSLFGPKSAKRFIFQKKTKNPGHNFSRSLSLQAVSLGLELG